MSIDTTIRPGESPHDRLYKLALALVDEHLPYHDRPENRHPPGFLLRRRLRKGLVHLGRVVEINPRNYAAMWVAGMTCRRLGDLEGAFDWFGRAHEIRPDQPDVAREAGIVASYLGRLPEAIRFAERARAARPSDPSLTANLALYHLLNQDPATAKRLGDAALAADPSDKITERIVHIVDDVLAGRRPCPRSVAELERSKPPAR